MNSNETVEKTMSRHEQNSVDNLDSNIFSKYTASPEEYAKFLKRLRHIAAVFLEYPVEEESHILITSSPRYEKQTGLINFNGYLRGFAGSGVELNISFPFSFVENASDEELANWIEKVIENGKNGKPNDR